ncbi:hypothetical protein [Sphingomicrobium nitratireducens]|uniref:hypothetical protein n=1 Tax=Sphingomicrobium nitratireducens TaxID=2964666 RepID=UPI00223F1591|nr:hypothetical protein [Sphingomicrobium nitratireducens]
MNTTMFAVALAAFVTGLIVLARRGGGPEKATPRHIFGMMAVALGLFLFVFSIGLGGTA